MSDHEPSPELPPVEPAGEGPMRFGQFKISTLLSSTAIVCFLIAWIRIDTMLQHVDGNLADGGFWPELAFFGIFFAPPLTCIPFLIDRLLMKRDGLNFNLFWRIWLTVCVGIYSMLMLMLATTAFAPVWKGSKGMSWFYYTLDGRAGMTLWPIYGIGVGLFITGVVKPLNAAKNPMLLVGVTTCAIISAWYTLATLTMNFTGPGDDHVFAIVPGASGVCYFLFCGIILRNHEFKWRDYKQELNWLIAWFAGMFISILAKYPLATNIYYKLPDERPEGCFVVTAATRGHREFVGTWYDADQNRLLNQQLLTFWKFESWLKSRAPLLHRGIRRVYNRIGPVVARSIVFRWQADLVYLFLKPLELLIKVAGLFQGK